MDKIIKILVIMLVFISLADASMSAHLDKMHLGSVDAVTILSIGLMISMGHCIGMCGGIVMAYSASKIDPQWNKVTQGTAHLLYSLGRVTTYTIMGIIFGTIGSAVAFSNTSIGIMTIIAGVAMILAGLSLAGKLKFLTKIEHSLSSSPTYSKLFRQALSSKSKKSFYLLGMLNGILPCGPVYIFAIAAAATGSALLGGSVMFLFGLSTIPALWILGMLTGQANKFKYKKVMAIIASILVVLYGLWTIKRGAMFIQNQNISPKIMATKAYKEANQDKDNASIIKNQ